VGAAGLENRTRHNVGLSQHPGRARYCETPASADKPGFLHCDCSCIGHHHRIKRQDKKSPPAYRSRVAGGDLTFVIDESANLYPSHNYRLARPPRICWLIELINRGASVALLVTPNFFETQADYIDKSGLGCGVVHAGLRNMFSLRSCPFAT